MGGERDSGAAASPGEIGDSEQDGRSCAAALRLGWISTDDLVEVLQNQERLRQAGRITTLVALLQERGRLTAGQAEGLLRDVGKAAGLGSELPIPSKLGRYELQAELGRGGMGVVYRAFDPKLNRSVALKVVEAGGHADRLQREAAAAGRLRHANIVTPFDAGEEGGRAYLAMELVQGKTLEETWLALPLPRRVQAVETVARAMGYAHAHGVIHRDLKPSNVMVSADGTLKVMDLGLARIEGEGTLTSTGGVMGTPAYMAPEQVRGERVGPAADVYSLGVMLYEALTGRIPFEATQLHKVYMSILTSETPRPRAVDPRIPVELEIVCLKAMEKEVPRRYPSAEALAEDLRRWREGEPIQARPTSRFRLLRRRLRRNPMAWAGAAAAVLALVLGAVGIAWLAYRRAQEREVEEWVAQAGVCYAEGDLDEARRLAGQALERIPRHAGAHYWLARAAIREYQKRRGLPDVRIGRGMVEVLPLAPETDELRGLREEAVTSLSGTSGGALVEGVRALWDGRYEDALGALQRAADEERPRPGGWEVDVWMAQALYYLGRFEEARNTLEPRVTLDPSVVGPVWANVTLATGMEAHLRGQESSPWFEQAVSMSSRMEAAGLVKSRIIRARALVEWGRAWTEMGRDPGEKYDQAARELEGMAGNVEALVTRGDLFMARAGYGCLRGRLDLEDPAEFKEAIWAYSQAVDIDRQYAAAFWKRAEAHRARWEYLTETSRPRSEDLVAAQADYVRAVELLPGFVEAAIGRAWAEGTISRDNQSDRGRIDVAWKQQIRILDDLVEGHPDLAVSFLARAEACFDLGNHRQETGRLATRTYKAALRDIGRALAINPRNGGAYRSRADVWLALAGHVQNRGGDPVPYTEAAVRDMRAATGINANDATAWVWLGYIFIRRGRYAGMMVGDPAEDYRTALETLERAIAVNPANALAYFQRGVVWRNMAQDGVAVGADMATALDRAVSNLNRSIEINPNYADSYRVRASIRHIFARTLATTDEQILALYDESIRDCNEAIRIQPRNPVAYGQRGTARLTRARLVERRGGDPLPDLELAISDETEATRLNPTYMEGFRWRSQAWADVAQIRIQRGGNAQEAFDASLADLSRAIDVNPTYPNIREEWAKVRTELGVYRASSGEDPTPDYEAAIARYTEILESHPDRGSSLNGRATVNRLMAEFLDSKGEDASPRFEAVIEDLGRLLATTEKEASVRFVRGAIAAEFGRYLSGRRLDPTAAYEASLEDLQRAVALDPSAPEPWTELGRTWSFVAAHRESRGENDRAQEAWEETLTAFGSAVSIAPQSVEALRGRGRALLALGRPREAIADLERALQLDPSKAALITPFLERARQDAERETDFR